MADPNTHDADYNDRFPTLDNILACADGSLGIEGFDDVHFETNIISNDKEVNQIGRDTSKAGTFGVTDQYIEQMAEMSFNDHPSSENIMLDVDMNQFGNHTSQAGPSHVNDQSDAHTLQNINQERLSIRVAEWEAVPPMPYTCTSCQVLREIIHTIDGETRKFQIHGQIGTIHHGILEICRGDSTAPHKEYQTFDFCEETLDRVKMFLVQYCEERRVAGYTMVNDSLLAFYETLSVGSDWDFSFEFDDSLQESPIHIDENIEQQPEATNPRNVSQPPAQRNRVRSKRKRGYNEQRDYIDALRVKDLVDYFNIPLKDAAEKIDVGETAIKNVCKRENFKWPHRQIRKFENIIKKSTEDLNAADPRKIRTNAEAAIQNSKREIESYYARFQ